MQVLAHRGYRTKYPENTRISFRKAQELGVHGIELDVRLTKDGKPVVVHDASVDRTSNGTGLISEMMLEQIRALDAGEWFKKEFAGERFLTLGEALEIVGGVRLNIHLKAMKAREEMVERVVEEVKRHNALGSAYLSAEGRLLERAKRLEPRIGGCYLGPHPRNTPEYIETSLELECYIIQLPCEQIDVEFVELAHQRGLEVHALHLEGGSIDEEDLYQRLVGCGVDGVLTDYPAAWLKKLDEIES